MWYGEGKRKLKNGEYEAYRLADLQRDFPDSWEKLRDADSVNRKMYNEYVERINQALESIYPNVLEDAKKRLERLEANLDYYRQKLERAGTPEDRKRLETTILLTAGQANSLRQEIESGDVLVNKRLMPREDYYHHTQEIVQGFGKLAQILSTPADIDTSLVGVSDYTKPKSRWTGFMQRRKGDIHYSEDSIAAMVDYIKDAEYKINLDPIIARNRSIISGLAEQTKNTRNANRFIEWMTEWTNGLAGKTNMIDRPFQKVFNRKSMQALRWLNNRVKANAVVGNLGSAVAQFLNLPNSLAYVRNPVDWANGLRAYTMGTLGSRSARSAMDQSGFLLERYGIDKAEAMFREGAGKELLKAPQKFTGWLLTFGDEQTARLIWNSAYSKAVRTKQADPVAYVQILH